MLYSVDEKPVRRMARTEEYKAWRRLISDDDFETIVDALNEYADEHRSFVSSHIPGADWRGKPYQAIYEALKNKSETAPRFMFGLIVWKVMMDRPDAWVFMRAEKNMGGGNEDVQGLTYFRRDGI